MLSESTYLNTLKLLIKLRGCIKPYNFLTSQRQKQCENSIMAFKNFSVQIKTVILCCWFFYAFSNIAVSYDNNAQLAKTMLLDAARVILRFINTIITFFLHTRTNSVQCVNLCDRLESTLGVEINITGHNAFY